MDGFHSINLQFFLRDLVNVPIFEKYGYQFSPFFEGQVWFRIDIRDILFTILLLNQLGITDFEMFLPHFLAGIAVEEIFPNFDLILNILEIIVLLRGLYFNFF
jgi:hypothetical protein